MNQPVAAIGMSWFRDSATFVALRAMFEDGHKLHRTYDEWLRAAEYGRKSQQVKGARVVRAYLDPHEFPQWCKAKGLKLDADARMQFASWVAHQVITGARAE